jgi:hypothetical protein
MKKERSPKPAPDPARVAARAAIREQATAKALRLFPSQPDDANVRGDVARALLGGIGRTAFYCLAKKGKLTLHRVGGAVCVKAGELRRALASK